MIPAEGYQFQGLRMPAHLQQSLELYTLQGRPTGDFLRACLANDLIGASFRADDRNMHILPVIAAYIAHNVPPDIRGSEEAIAGWLRKKAEERAAGLKPKIEKHKRSGDDHAE